MCSISIGKLIFQLNLNSTFFETLITNLNLIQCFWTDTYVQKYIRNEYKRFRTIVANRVSEIREASEG